MVKVYISLPNETHEFIKKILKERKITISEYACGLIEKERKFQEKFPFIGMFHFGKNASDNDGIDEAICDEIEGKYK